MTKPMKIAIAAVAVILSLGITAVFQNCAKAKFIDPDKRHTLIATGFCQECADETGTGLSCRQDQVSSFSSCFYESCRPGFKRQLNQCVPVICTPGDIANCAIVHGEGRMTCNATGVGYGSCTGTSCDSGYTLQGGVCVALEVPPPPADPPPVDPPPVDPPPPFCVAGNHRDCSTPTTEGTETCNEAGTAYGECVFGDCKAGYYKNDAQICVAYACTPTEVTPCTEGSAVGFQTCNSNGSGWGACVLNGCQSGYVFKGGVCVVQVCTPNQESVCEFNKGSGVKICNSDGTDYGVCFPQACDTGYYLESSQCHQQKCTPGSPIQCQENSGSGTKYCYENGHGYGTCTLSTCDEGFRVKNGKCVGKDSCEAGDPPLACTEKNGSGFRSCIASNENNENTLKLGPCELTQCNSGFKLVVQGGKNACKKD